MIRPIQHTSPLWGLFLVFLFGAAIAQPKTSEQTEGIILKTGEEAQKVLEKNLHFKKLAASQGHYLTALVFLNLSEKMSEGRVQKIMKDFETAPNTNVVDVLQREVAQKTGQSELSSLIAQSITEVFQSDFLVSLIPFLAVSGSATHVSQTLSQEVIQKMKVQLTPILTASWMKLMGMVGFGLGIAAQDVTLGLLETGRMKKSFADDQRLERKYFIADFFLTHEQNTDAVFATLTPAEVAWVEEKFKGQNMGFEYFLREYSDKKQNLTDFCKGISKDFKEGLPEFSDDDFTYKKIFCTKLQLQLMNFKDQKQYQVQKIDWGRVAKTVTVMIASALLFDKVFPTTLAGLSLMKRIARYGLFSLQSLGLLKFAGILEKQIEQTFHPLSPERVQKHMDKIFAPYANLQRQMQHVQLDQSNLLSTKYLEQIEPLIEQEEVILNDFYKEFQSVALQVMFLSLMAQDRFFNVLVGTNLQEKKHGSAKTEEKIKALSENYYTVMQDIQGMNRCGLSRLYDPTLLLGMDTLFKNLACSIQMYKNMQRLLQQMIPSYNTKAPWVKVDSLNAKIHFDLLKDQRAREKIQATGSVLYKKNQKELRYPLQMILFERHELKAKGFGEFDRLITKILPRSMLLNRSSGKEDVPGCISNAGLFTRSKEETEVATSAQCYSAIIEKKVLPLLMTLDATYANKVWHVMQ